VRRWREETPEDFLFARKASKFITHWRRLTEKCENSIALMETRLKVLGPKAGRCCSSCRRNSQRTGSASLPFSRCCRGATFTPSSSATRAGTRTTSSSALCLSDHHDAPSPWVVTAPHIYVRGHGPGGRYRDNYPDKTLRGWARDIARWGRQRRKVFVYFDNDQKSAAPADAQRLLALLGKSK
jgi:uncharacterized protein YecE (DUF72 family)